MIKSAKRSKNERQGLHIWHPYYAGYSEAFVTSVLEEEALEDNALVLDPWLGSGTTGIVCQQRNINFVGSDINPVMAYFSAAKNMRVISLCNETGVQKLDEIVKNYKKEKSKKNSLPDLEKILTIMKY